MAPKEKIMKHIARYAQQDNYLAFLHLAPTIIIYTFTYYVDQLDVIRDHNVLRALFVLFCAAVRIRLFMIFHDMMHYTFFKQKYLNDIGSQLLGLTSWTSPSYWKKTHDFHHIVLNNIDEIDQQNFVWTAAKFSQEPSLRKQMYILIRSGFAKLTYVPLIHFGINMKVRAQWYENVATVMYFYVLYYLWGFGAIVHEAMVIGVSSWYGFFVFNLQHIFDAKDKRGNVVHSKRWRNNDWDRYSSATEGASTLVIPSWMRWVHFGNEYHTIHHLNKMIPGYKLHQCYEDGAGLFDEFPHITLKEALLFSFHTLYDEEKQRFERIPNVKETFREVNVKAIIVSYLKAWQRSIEKDKDIKL